MPAIEHLPGMGRSYYGLSQINQEEATMQFERHSVWSILLRLFHWSFALSIVVLGASGFYIHSPWTSTMLEGTLGFPMATMRFVHFVSAFVFTGALLARVYLLLFGNKQEKFWDFLPVTAKNIRNVFQTIAFYGYIGKHIKNGTGHNSLAGIAYGITFIMATLQIMSGFYMLYPESASWQLWGLQLFGPQQQGRFIHYLIMWYFIVFALTHLYIILWNDLRTKEGVISSIFNGVKYFPKEL
jgi:Ni/Fe-hydrogenase 1 B-type cytochrome subunit